MSSKVRKRSTEPVPSFKGLSPSSEAASRAKKANGKRDAKPELLLRRALWSVGLRYRKHVRGLPGNPDVVFPSARVVVFSDGDFWHGRNWAVLQEQLLRRHNADYWVAKISRNRETDQIQTSRPTEEGWMVLRFWESVIVRDPAAIASQVREAVELRQPGKAAAKSPPASRNSSGSSSA
ncbi:very short patch repair endonuclease [Schlesneria sp. DSM 10557]|uniref:very short patch repair endonuclease n=1 Tax=Schlesneria sp. DSM 10557 TaxID=3044399 RepID=UPI00359F4ACE